MKDFSIENNGENTYLTYKVGENEKIDTVIIGMTEHNNIQGLLPMIILQINQTKSLRYDISSKIPLSEMFSNVVRKESFLKVLLGIMNALIRAEDYMIEQEAFIIDMEHVYVNPSNYETSLICFPIIRDEAVMHLDEFVKSLVFSAKYDQTENCDYIAKLINFLNGQPFTVYGFKKQLEEILGMAAPGEEQQAAKTNVSGVSGGMPSQTTAGQGIPRSGGQSQPAAIDIPMNSANSSAVPLDMQIPGNPMPANAQTVVDSSQFKQDLIPGNPQEVPKKEKHRLFGRKKEKEPKNNKKEEKVKPDKGKEKKAAKTATSAGFINGMIIPGQTVVNDANGNKVGVSNSNTPEGLTGIAGQANLSKLPNTSFEQIQTSFGETMVLGVGGGNGFSDETTILGVDSGAVPNAYLIRRKNNEQVKINSSFFRIGKEHSTVDYFIGDNTAISRSHANILRKGPDFYIVDTNSKNHTYVNGMMITPNMETKLNNGTIICLADEEFEFKIM